MFNHNIAHFFLFRSPTLFNSEREPGVVGPTETMAPPWKFMEPTMLASVG